MREVFQEVCYALFPLFPPLQAMPRLSNLDFNTKRTSVSRQSEARKARCPSRLVLDTRHDKASSVLTPDRIDGVYPMAGAYLVEKASDFSNL